VEKAYSTVTWLTCGAIQLNNADPSTLADLRFPVVGAVLNIADFTARWSTESLVEGTEPSSMSGKACSRQLTIAPNGYLEIPLFGGGRGLCAKAD
jgi:hypothetical protein